MKSSELLKNLTINIEKTGEVLYINVSELDFIDSAVLGVFIRAHDLANKQNKRLIFTHLSKYVKNMFDSSRIGRVLNVNESQDD